MEKFANLPTPVKWVLGVTGAGALIGTGTAISAGHWQFLAMLLGLLVLLVGGYFLWTAWRRKKQNAKLGGELQQHSTAAPRELSDPGQRARLDDLRKKFESGVEAYRSRGKDLYKLPWYVIVGEPGSGKTEAIRHSNVGFPPGMQDEFQGVGGTINMNWWFTNHAVLLDTAGRLMFEEVKPGETSEWKEFLLLLKKNRPTCPINGLFLVIPSDSLIMNSADEIQKKAGKIAQQLDVIQRVLDVRFPVFVVVTKCDKVNGFREFFDGLTDPQLQHQIMGWSNPEPLDKPFRPELVDQHLEKVVGRLRRRRLGLMRDPVPESAARRTDEVDSLYALPTSLSLLGPRLRRYLETIFIAGEWSAKPLFLRGIYFSSSMREGSALDQELADVLGVSPDALPEGKVWERDRSYFLRDLFLEKVFKEKGLVTRATNTNTMLRRRQITLFACGFLAIVFFIAVAKLSMNSLQSSVKGQSDYWSAVYKAGWHPNKTWKQSIIPMSDKGAYASYVTNLVEVDGKQKNLGEFHAALRRLVEKPLPDNRLIPALAKTYNQNSKKAQLIVFENGVVKPLVEAAQQKITSDAATDPESQKRQSDALAALIQLEAEILRKGKGKVDADAMRKLTAPLLSYVTGRETSLDTNLVATLVWTYSENAEGRGAWPPRWLSGAGTSATNSLAANLPIRAGLDQFIRVTTTSFQNQVAGGNPTTGLRNALREFQTQENALFEAASQGADLPRLKPIHDKLEKAKTAVDSELPKVAGGSLTNAYAVLSASVATSLSGAFAKVKAVVDQVPEAERKELLFVEIQRRLEQEQAKLKALIEKAIPAGDQEELKKLDESYLAKPGYAERWHLYEQAMKLVEAKPFQNTKLVERKGEQLTRFLKDSLGPVRDQVAVYSGKFKTGFTQACNVYLQQAEKQQKGEFMALYLQEAGLRLKELEKFPLAKNATSTLAFDDLKKGHKSLIFISQDFAEPIFQTAPFKDNDDWKKLTSRIAGYAVVAEALMGGDSPPGRCTISLLKMDDPPNSKDEWRRERRRITLTPEADFKRIDTNNPDEPLGKVETSQSIDLFISDQDGNKKIPFTFGEWGALRLLFQRDAPTPQKMDAQSWKVEVSVRDGNKDMGAIRLKLEFGRPLPDLKDWPAQ